ncbi:MAG: CotH kinase family protein, partial [Opitutales bacterium]|nr:CotH kinase family protein [Opitutales bacterium]
INYQLFQDQAVATFGEVNLRNGGDDWEETLLRDAMIPSFVENQMEAGLYTYRPSGLFLNGEFWGIYNIRKRFDQTYFANEHALAEDQYDLVKYAHDETGTTILQADAGTTDAYSTFLAFCTTNDTSNAAIYSQIEDQMNIDSFIDYVVGTDYAVNTSWNHN